MLKSYTYQYKVDPQMFRKALYFNTFAKQRIQSVLVIVMWLLGMGLLIANLVFKVEMTSVMQLCYIVLLIALPLLIFSCENSYRQYRSAPMHDKLREISMCEDWIKLHVVGGADSEKLEWRMVAAAYELKDFFILYRDLNLMVLIPKDVVPEQDLPGLRTLLTCRLGRAFRCRA